MYCQNCGSNIQDGAQFCTICGHSPYSVAPRNTEHNNMGYSSTSIPTHRSPVSTGGWIGRSLIPLIPIVGGLIYFIMLFVWANDKSKEETFNNWAKAQLLVMFIGVIIAVAVFLFVMMMSSSVSS